MVDDLDLQIIQVLRKDARLSYRKIAKQLGVATGTVLQRIKRMENQKIIENYHADIDYTRLGYAVAAVIAIIAKREKFPEIQRRMLEHKNVFGFYEVSGEYECFIAVRFKNMEELNEFIKKEFDPKYVNRVTTFIILKTEKEKHTLLD